MGAESVGGRRARRLRRRLPYALAMHRRALAAVTAFGLATTACGAGQQSAFTAGGALFRQACGACHTISGVNTPSHQGGDLLSAHLRRPVLLQFAREMPLRRRLGPRELDAVVDYILRVQHRAR